MRKKVMFDWCFAAWMLASAVSVQAAELVPLGSMWKYRLGTQDASSPADAWRQIVFDDSAWDSGGAPIGYDWQGTPGTTPIVTVTPNSGEGNFMSIYFRKTFTVANPAAITELVLSALVDDGAIAWLNGREAGRSNVADTGELGYLDHANEAAETRTLTTTNLASLLVAGTNVVALHVFNANQSSSDLVMDALLTAVVDEPPVVLDIEPAPGSVVLGLTSINVTFSENVTGVNAADLRIANVPATGLSVISPREYTFNFPQPPTGAVSIAWAAAPGIADLDDDSDLFVPGASWTYTLDPNAVTTAAIISEFQANNENGIRDDDGDRSDWLEIYNPGPAVLNLGGWFLTDDPANLAQWRFPGINLPANRYLLVWASQKDRANPAAPLHTNFKLAKDAGGYLALVNPATNVVSEYVAYPAQPRDVSYGRDRLDPDSLGFFITPTPGAQNSTSGAGFAPEPGFSLESGIYTNNSLTLTITVPPGTTVRYRLDGYEPANNSTAYTGPITITANTLIKARAYPSNAALWPSRVVANTYILLDSSTRDFNSNLPTLIISTQGRGIPANVPPGGTRPRGSLVALDTVRGRSSLQGKIDFIGLGQFEITGQTSAGFAKPPYRIELNDELGNDLDAPLLGLPAESDWILRNPYSDKCLMNDFLGYELWEDIGQYSCRRRFVEVFVDTGANKLSYPGDYMGVMVLFERIKIGARRVDIARLTPAMTNEPAISGGYIFKQDKDSEGDTSFSTDGGAGHSGHVFKFHDPKPKEISQVQSNWIRNYVRQFESAMYAANWTNATGTNHYSYYIDVDAFVDQHLHVEFTKQIDGYRLSSYYSKDRNGKLKPEPIWDWNLSFGNADYLQGGKTNGWYWNNQGEGMSSYEHVWLRRLVYGQPYIDGANPANGPGDPDFRQKITDRWAVLRTNVLNGDRVVARINELATLLTEAADRNYAKYPGILNTYLWPNPEGPPNWDVDYTQPTYAAIISEMAKWAKGRYVWMDSQFLQNPRFNLNPGPVQAGASLTLSASAGSIYYTLDGSDPRLPGGRISPAATRYTSSIKLNANTRVVARAYSNPTALWTPWSGPADATFVVQTPKLVITEIMYHPLPPPLGDTNDESNFEYLELKNISAASLDLTGFTLGGGVSFTFPNLSLAAGQRALVVKNQAAFAARYGAGGTIAGEYTGSLGNQGNRLILQGRWREPVLDFTYEDGWYPITDGFGFSLVVVDENAPADAWSAKAQWRPGGALGGTPGEADGPPPAFPPIIINEALTHSDPAPPYDTIELHNPSASDADLGGWFLTDDFRAPKKFRIPPGTTIPARGYRVFDETDFNVSGGGNTAFSLSSQGEEVYLFSADANGNLTGYCHGFDFGPARSGVTFGRFLASTGKEHFVPQAAPTLGARNAGPLAGPVVISEIMYRPPDVATNGADWDNSEDEYLELRNLQAVETPLYDPNAPTNTWRLRNAVDFDFPANVVLPARGRLLVVGFDPQKYPALRMALIAKYRLPVGVPMYGPWDGKLDNSGETIELKRPDNPEVTPTGVTIPYCLAEKIAYRDSSAWPTNADGNGRSLQRLQLAAFGNDPINWQAVTPFSTNLVAPAIVEQPAGLALPAGAGALFSVYVRGSDPLKFQWYFNATNLIPAATNAVLAWTNAQPAQAGSYHVVITNLAGSVASAAAALTVTNLDANLDTDGDGLPDAWELANGTDVQVSDANADPDHDGLTNWQEYLAGTHPNNAANVLRIESVQRLPDNTIVLTFTAASNRTYSVLYQNLLTVAPWLKLLDIPAAPQNRPTSITNAPGGAARFYRLVTPKQD